MTRNNTNNMNLNLNHHKGYLMKYQMNGAQELANATAMEQSQQSRCFLCDIPKPEYSLTKSFSELICRGCLNYEGPDRVEQLIAEAYQFKKRQASPIVNATTSTTSSPISSNTQVMRNSFANLNAANNIGGVQPMAYNSAEDGKQIFAPIDSGHGSLNGTGNVEGSSMVFARLTANKPNMIPVSSRKSTQPESLSPSLSQAWNNQGAQARSSSLAAATCEPCPTKVGPEQEALRYKTGGYFPSTSPIHYAAKGSIFVDFPKSDQYGVESITSDHRNSNRPFYPTKTCAASPGGVELSQHFRLASKSVHQDNNDTKKESSDQVLREKRDVSPTKHANPLAGINYATTQQQQQLMAATSATSFDPFQMMRVPMNSACGSIDQLVRMHQQSFHLKDAANIERELARLQNEALLTDVARKSYQLDSNSKNQDYMHRLVQDHNAALGLSFYQNGSLPSCGSGPPYFVQPQQSCSNQTTNSNRPSGNNNRNSMKPAATAIPPNLYGQYHVSMAPYMSSNGPLICATQYHPYHYHPSSFQSPSYNNMLGSPGSGVASSQCYAVPNQPVTNENPSVSDKSDRGDSGTKLERLLINAIELSPMTNSHSDMRYDDEQPPPPDDEKNKTSTSPERNIRKTNRNMNDGDRNIDDKSKRKEVADVSVIDLADSCSSLIVPDKDREPAINNDCRDESTLDSIGARARKSVHNRINEDTTINSNTARAKNGLHCRTSPLSPPPAKRVPTAPRPLARNDATTESKSHGPNNTGSHSSSSFMESSSRPFDISPSMMAKNKTQTSNLKQSMTRRSHGAINNERPSVDTASKKMRTNSSVPTAADTENSRRKFTNDDLSRVNQESTTKGGFNQQSDQGEEDKIRNNAVPQRSEGNPKSHPKENSSNNNNGKAAEVHSPVDIASTASPSSRKLDAVEQQLKQQQAQQSQQRPQHNFPHKYAPLRCLTCLERLEDRHFVQCPSVMSHKFCFACSKASIEQQQLENAKLGNGYDRIFCPSGRRCFLATEQTPWTFMNSEIETIFRESSRVSGSGPNEFNNLNSRVNSSAQAKSKPQLRSDSNFEQVEVSDKFQRSSSRLSSSGVKSMQNKCEGEEVSDSKGPSLVAQQPSHLDASVS